MIDIFKVMSILKIFKNKLKTIVPASRKLKLEHVHTFRGGEKLYTYQAKDLQKVAYKHYQIISEYQAYISAFGSTKAEWERGLELIDNESMKGLDDPSYRTKALSNVMSIAREFKRNYTSLKSTNESFDDALLCMFYVLEDEKEATFDELTNERKIKLFNSEPDMKAFFLDFLNPLTENYKTTSYEDLKNLLINSEIIKQSYLNLSTI